MKRWPLVASFVLFIAVCVSAAYWAMQLFKPPVRSVAAPPQVTRVDVKLDAAAALFGGRMTPIAVASNFQLKGVVMAGNAAESIAILSADGKPAQATRINTEIVPGVTVKEVHARYVLLSDNGVSKRVDLPEGAKAEVSMLGVGEQVVINAPPLNNNAPMSVLGAVPVNVPPPQPVAPGPDVNTAPAYTLSPSGAPPQPTPPHQSQ